MTNEQPTTEQPELIHALDLALELLRSGKSHEEVLNRFPQFKDEIRELIALASQTRDAEIHIQPSQEFAQRVVEQFGSNVTQSQDNRSTMRGVGRASRQQPMMKNVFMRSPVKIFAPIGGALVLLVLIFGVYQLRQSSRFAANLESDLESGSSALEGIDFDGYFSDEIALREVEDGVGEAGGLVLDTATPGTPIEEAALAAEEQIVLDDFDDIEDFFDDEAFNSELDTILQGF